MVTKQSSKPENVVSHITKGVFVVVVYVFNKARTSRKKTFLKHLEVLNCIIFYKPCVLDDGTIAIQEKQKAEISETRKM